MQKMQPVPKFKLSTNSDASLIYETSLVDNPATGANFLAFSKDGNDAIPNNLKFKEVGGAAQRMLSGVWFMPNTEYVRTTPEGLVYIVEMSEKDLFDATLKFLKTGYSAVTVEHDGHWLFGFKDIEQWVYRGVGTTSPIFGHTLEDLGYNAADIPLGTILKTIYVGDEEFWNSQVVTGNVKGFSIGGLFDLTKVQEAATAMFSAAATEQPVSSNVTDEAPNVTEEAPNVTDDQPKPTDIIKEKPVTSDPYIAVLTEQMSALHASLEEMRKQLDEAKANKDKEETFKANEIVKRNAPIVPNAIPLAKPVSPVTEGEFREVLIGNKIERIRL